MIKTMWTKEQEEAIHKTGTNLLISAGAGSGKTAVLTERILEKLKSGLSVDQILVLTFTNAAAFEMKERVRNKLIKEIESGRNVLQKELDKLDSAFICTFDSFSLSFVKKYHYLLGVSPNIQIGDNVVLTNQKKKIIDQVFLSFYGKKSSHFLKFIDTFSVKDDSKLQDYIYNIALKLDHLHDKTTYLNTYMDAYYTKEKIDSVIKVYEKMLEEHRNELFGYLEIMEAKVLEGPLLEWYQKFYEALIPLEKGNTYETFRKSIFIKFSSLTRSKKIDEEEREAIRNDYIKIKEHFEFLKKHCTYENKEVIRKELEETSSTVKVIVELLKEYENQMMIFKKKNNLYEFSDIARFAINILENHSSIRNLYQSEIKEIMIDEYQDTNDIGEYFISLLAKDNVYMVGDVKQSIYGFRNANPFLFMDKYESYKQNGKGYKIDLVSNFRSRGEVIKGINTIFENLMTIDMGGADYKKGHQMIFGNKTYDQMKSSNQKNQLQILDYHYEKGNFTKEEIEAFIVAKDIKEKIENHYQVANMKAGILRDATYGDFCILLDRKGSFDLYKKIFTYFGIPLSIHKEEPFVSSDEIYVVRSILKLLLCIQNRKYSSSSFSHALMSVARSFLFSYSDEDLLNLYNEAKMENKILYKVMQRGSFRHLYEILDALSSKLDALTVRELLEEIYISFDIYNKIGQTKDVELRTAKLEYLLEIAHELQDIEYGLEDCIAYFDSSLKNQIDVSFSTSNNREDSVSIMTIHKSKGLEFPICYYSGLYKKFSVKDFKDKFLYSDSYGIIVPVFQEGIKETIYKDLIKYSYHKKDIFEKIRLFYVALTRAKEQIILVTNLRDTEAKEMIETIGVQEKCQYQSFYDMLVSIKKTISSYIIPVDTSVLELTADYLKTVKTSKLNNEKSTKDIPVININIQKSEVKDTHFSGFGGILDKEVQKQMELGTLLHKYLELIDFDIRELEYQKYNIPLFYREKIEKLFKLPFLNSTKENNIYKEYEFISKKDGVKTHGIIDLLIETEDTFYIVDYKLKDINKEGYQKQVKGYKNYIEAMTNKKVEGYLYSLLEGIYKKV